MEMPHNDKLSLNRLFLALGILVLLCNCESLGVVSVDTLLLGASLTVNQTILSKNGTFELGFFSPNETNNWYIGIWYAQFSEKTVVWVANRETPIKDMHGVLKLSTDGYLTLSDSQGGEIWSSNENQQIKAASRAVIFDTGNFAMLGGQNTSEIVWESFRHPTDTILPMMKLWKGLKIISWKSSVDPAPGSFVLEMNPSPEKRDFLLRHKSGPSYWSSGDWLGSYYASQPGIISYSPLAQDLVQFSPTSMYYIYWLRSKPNMMMAREVMNWNGDLLFYLLIDNSKWSMIWSEPQAQCGVYGLCGAYGVCYIDQNIQSCTCVEGFQPKDYRAWSSEEWWSSGCVRRTPLHCSAYKGTTDGFLQLRDKSLSDDKAVEYSHETTLQGCRTACLINCSCTAFAISTSSPFYCRLWFGDLLDIFDSLDSGQGLFIRLAASDLLRSSSNGRITGRDLAISISLTMGGVVLALLFALFIRRRRGRLLQKYREEDMPASLRTFTYKELKTATNNFNRTLGKGAFGSVFQGSLSNGTLVAVKKLAGSRQDEKQFRAEISSVGNIHHVNLIRLRGFCSEASRRLLVYDYMPNGSLNSFLFNHNSKKEGKGKVLDWKKRFEIALGIARGLIYLHENCRDRIIHADVKPENILLDDDFSPKLADFGLAKLVGRDLSDVLTTTRGTRGYLAPEWIYGLPITPKVDVYSFGMTLFELISGRRNVDLNVEESSLYYFPSWATSEINKGNMMNIVDKRIADTAVSEEVRRATLVSLLCIQNDENVRPSMDQVLLMLEGKIEAHRPQISNSELVEVDRGSNDSDGIV